MQAACNMELQRLQLDVKVLQSQQQQQRRTTQLCHIWTVMGDPVVGVLMALVGWHRDGRGRRSALQALDITR